MGKECQNSSGHSLACLLLVTCWNGHPNNWPTLTKMFHSSWMKFLIRKNCWWVKTLSALSSPLSLAILKNHREHSNIKARVSVHWRAQCHTTTIYSPSPHEGTKQVLPTTATQQRAQVKKAKWLHIVSALCCPTAPVPLPTVSCPGH